MGVVLWDLVGGSRLCDGARRLGSIRGASAGTGRKIGCVFIIEHGNVFLEMEDPRDRHRRLLEGSGDLLTERLVSLPGPVCLICAEWAGM